ncbi:HXXEE domain-containing protein [Bacillus sp. JJ1521]|uniref:HXXEE domain-containing protein n=1 Tax=Bacillus sp. JJ1521 TaxID=3122957 RepID=UPI003F68B4CE
MLVRVYELFFIETIIWLFPVIFMFHGLEEIITIESFITKYKNKIRETSLVKLTLTIKKSWVRNPPNFLLVLHGFCCLYHLSHL